MKIRSTARSVRVQVPPPRLIEEKKHALARRVASDDVLIGVADVFLAIAMVDEDLSLGGNVLLDLRPIEYFISFTLDEGEYTVAIGIVIGLDSLTSSRSLTARPHIQPGMTGGVGSFASPYLLSRRDGADERT
jgi:hypothetical protein